MFGKRPDGKKIKGISGFDRMAALFVGKTRVEATNYFTIDTCADVFDEYIKKNQAHGVQYTYRDIVIASLVRMFYLRKRLNRFVMLGDFYQRNFIDVSMVVHKSLKIGAEESTIKCRFTGKETIAEIKTALDASIKQAVEGTNDTDLFTRALTNTPTFFLRIVVGMIKLLDRWGMLSDNFLYTTSPFHCSIFFADLKSIHLDTVWHHLYNFGNCGFFVSMGKEKKKPVCCEKTNEIKAKRIVELGVSIEERFIDGLYYSGMIKAVRRIWENPSCLEIAPKDDEIKREPLTPAQTKS